MTIKVSDYIDADLSSAQLSITATNATGTSSKIASFTRDDSVSTKGIKLYFEQGSISLFYAWIGNTKLNGEWPGKALTQTHNGAGGKTYLVFDAGPVDSINFILNGVGGADQSRTKTGFMDMAGAWTDEDPLLPTKPKIAISLSNNSTAKKECER